MRGVSAAALLSTSHDHSDPAVRLYLRSGWQSLGMVSPGVQIMGRKNGACVTGSPKAVP